MWSGLNESQIHGEAMDLARCQGCEPIMLSQLLPGFGAGNTQTGGVAAQTQL